MSDLVVVVASRTRPASVHLQLSAAAATIRADTEFVYGLDTDDPQLKQTLAVIGMYPFASAEVGQRVGQTAVVNTNAMLAADRARAVGTMADYNVPFTEGWDERFLDALAERGVEMTWCTDGRGLGEGPWHVIMSSEAVRALGWICEPSMHHYCVDFVWGRLALLSGTYRHLPDVMIKHLSKTDLTHAEALPWNKPDTVAYHQWMKHRAVSDSDTLRALDGGRHRALDGMGEQPAVHVPVP